MAQGARFRRKRGKLRQLAKSRGMSKGAADRYATRGAKDIQEQRRAGVPKEERAPGKKAERFARRYQRGQESGLKGGSLNRFARQRKATRQTAVEGSEAPGGKRLGMGKRGIYRKSFDPRPWKRRAKQEELEKWGYGGKKLEAKMGRWQKREEKRMDRAAAERVMPDELKGMVDPSTYAHMVMKGQDPYQAFKRIAAIRGATKLFGYDEPVRALQDEMLGAQEEGYPVDLREETRPTYDFYGDYARTAPDEVNLRHKEGEMLPYMIPYTQERLNEGGLTPDEEASIRGRERGAVEGAYRTSTRQEGSRLAGMGQDPRSGMARRSSMQLGRERAGGLTDVERGITLQELARKQQLEGLGKGLAGIEEQARLGDVAADLRRRGQYEAMLGTAAPLDEASRRFDVGTLQGERGMGRGTLLDLARQREAERQWDLEMAEAARQAQWQREAAKRAAEKAEPTALDYAGGIVGGVFGGLTGGAS